MAAMLALAPAANAQGTKPEVVFTGTPWSVQNVSENGRYICGTRQYEEIYRYDLQERKLITVPAEASTSGIAALDVTNDGTLAGCADGSVELPALYKDGEWTMLPMPEGAQDGSAMQITGDGNTIVGLVMGSGSDKPYKVVPLVWEKQGDGSYKYVLLPDPETDFLGGKTQFVSPRSISDDGNIIVGIMMEQDGSYSTDIVYHKNSDGTWSYDLPLASLCYDGDKYQELKAEEPQLSEYSREEGESYMKMIERFQKDHAKWEYEFYNGFMTGKQFLTAPVVTSQDGTYLALATVVNTYTYEEGAQFIEKHQSDVYPSLYNMKTKELVEMPEVTGFRPYGVSNFGDMIYSDGTVFYILPHGEKQYIDVTEWLKNEYDFDLMAALPENTEYVESEAVAGDMSMIAGEYRSVTPEGGLDTQEIFCVLLPEGTSSIIKTLNTPESNLVAVEGGKLVFGGNAEDIRVYDICGREAMSAANASGSLDISRMKRGIYVVEATVGGKAVRCKVMKR